MWNDKNIIVEQGDKPHVYEHLTAEQNEWKELVRQAREQIRAELDEHQLPPPEEMLRQMRDERDAQLLAWHRRQPGHAPDNAPER
jgi:AMMECR1 domain-containing protein